MAKKKKEKKKSEIAFFTLSIKKVCILNDHEKAKK